MMDFVPLIVRGAAVVHLTQGKISLVDPADWPLTLGRRWWTQRRKDSKCWYAAAYVPVRQQILLHRTILGAPKGKPCDHKDGDGLNNRRSNIRICTVSQNRWNSRHRTNKWGYRGIYRDKCGRFRPQLIVNGKNINGRSFRDPLSAAKAWDEMAKKHHGEFANLNFPEQTSKSA